MQFILKNPVERIVFECVNRRACFVMPIASTQLRSLFVGDGHQTF